MQDTKRRTKDIFVIGFALFAMFFGAGNLIFPPSLGNRVGDQYGLAILGFLLTGVGLPLLGILTCIQKGGTFKEMTDRVGKRFSLWTNVALILAIGPLLVIPRTAATTYELGIKQVFPNTSSWATIIIYFLINSYFVFRPSEVVDIIGKFLTPLLFIMLALIIGKGIFYPIGEVTTIKVRNTFPIALLEGYQTMDALGSVIIASIIINSITSKGYKDKNQIFSVAWKAGFISAIGLACIYGGLTYLGAQTTTLFPREVEKTILISSIAKLILGFGGSIALGIAVSLACLTTSIALTTTSTMFFTELFQERISYKVIAVIITLISTVIASMGVNQIIHFAVPILSILYPIVIGIIAMTLMGKYVSDYVIRYTTYCIFIVSVLSTIASLGKEGNILYNFMTKIPFSEVGFAWVIPSIIAFVFLKYILRR